MTFELFRDKKKEWRWRLRARNGRIVATSGEGYKRKGRMISTLASIRLSIMALDWKQIEIPAPGKRGGR